MEDGSTSGEAALAHELTHAYQRDTGWDSSGMGPGGVPISEEQAVRMENAYRDSAGMSTRTTYGGNQVSNPRGDPLAHRIR